MELKAITHFQEEKFLCRKYMFDKDTENWWTVFITIKFRKNSDNPIIVFNVEPPITLPQKVRKALKFKTYSYKTLCKWLKEHEKETGKLV